MKCPGRLAKLLTITLGCFFAISVSAADTLTWNTNENRVTADITSVPLIRLLEGVSQLTGWHVYVESNATRNVSVKFKDLPPGQALRNLLGNLNFALVPQTNSQSRLYVFISSQKNATLLLQPNDLNGSRPGSTNAIPDELVVTLKSGIKPEQIPCLENAKVLGRIDGIDTYRVKFESEIAARTARLCLSTDPNVESIDSNFSMDQPNSGQRLDANIAADINLDLKQPSGDCDPVVAVLDTRGMEAVADNLKKFLLPTINVTQDGPGGTANNSGANGQELTHGLAMVTTVLRSVQTTTSGSSSVRILPVNVYGNNPTTTTFQIAQGIQRAVNSGANIVNLSLGSSGDSPFLRNLIQRASQQGVVFFGAAGNEPVTTPTYPAAYAEVIAVTAGDRNGQLASYANRGNFVDIMTPGMSVVPFNGQSYLVNGTSSATAYASGIAAGLASANSVCPPGVLSTMRGKLGVNLKAGN